MGDVASKEHNLKRGEKHLADYFKIVQDAENGIGFDSEWDYDHGVEVCAEEIRRNNLPSKQRGGGEKLGKNWVEAEKKRRQPKVKSEVKLSRLIATIVLDEELNEKLAGKPGTKERVQAWADYYAGFDRVGNPIQKILVKDS